MEYCRRVHKLMSAKLQIIGDKRTLAAIYLAVSTF